MKEIKLTQNKVALVDDEDFEFINQWKWYVAFLAKKKLPYAARMVYFPKKKTIYMHRVVAKNESTLPTDHIDGNTLNNQKNNLRVVTHAENLHNTGKSKNNSSGYKGVSWSKSDKKWVAQIDINKVHYAIGKFVTIEEAVSEYGKFVDRMFK